MRRDFEAALKLAREIDAAELPRLCADLEEIRVTIMARLSAPPASLPDENLNVPEAAKRLGVSPSYLYQHHARYKFTRRIGRKLLFSSAGIEAYMRRAR